MADISIVTRPVWTRHRRPAACGAVALILAGATVVASLRPVGWSPSALPRVDAHSPMGAAAKALDPGFRTVQINAYDGQFYWGIAVDPIATGHVHQAFDKPTYRYGHPLYGWLGWLFSAGRARAAPAALLAVGLASFLAATVLAGLLGRAQGRRGWEGLFVALNPGLLYSASHDLAEPLSVGLVLGALLMYVRGRRTPTLACLALLPLTKEQLLVVPLALAAWELARRRHPVTALLYVATLAPSIVWWIYARLHLGAWFTTGSTALTVPLGGWKRAVLYTGANTYSGDPNVGIPAEAALVVFIVLLGLLAIATLGAVRLRGPLELAFVPLALVAACLAPNATVYLRDALRNTAILVALVPFVLASPPLLARAARR